MSLDTTPFEAELHTVAGVVVAHCPGPWSRITLHAEISRGTAARLETLFVPAGGGEEESYSLELDAVTVLDGLNVIRNALIAKGERKPDRFVFTLQPDGTFELALGKKRR